MLNPKQQKYYLLSHMWPQNKIQTINPSELNSVVLSGSTIRPNTLKPTVVVNREEDINKMQKVYVASFVAGVAFLLIFMLLVMNSKIVLSGPYLPIYLALFPQKLEFVIRYKSFN